MTITELIKELDKYKNTYGDLEVVIEYMDCFRYADDAEDIVGLRIDKQYKRNVVVLENNGYIQ